MHFPQVLTFLLSLTPAFTAAFSKSPLSQLPCLVTARRYQVTLCSEDSVINLNLTLMGKSYKRMHFLPKPRNLSWDMMMLIPILFTRWQPGIHFTFWSYCNRRCLWNRTGAAFLLLFFKHLNMGNVQYIRIRLWETASSGLRRCCFWHNMSPRMEADISWLPSRICLAV